MRYLGSKTLLLPFIENVIGDVTKFSRKKLYIFADIFAGTGVVGKKFKEKGYYVISNDLQYYSYVLNKHYIENKSPMDNSLLLYLNSIRVRKGFVYKNYTESSRSGRICFSDENAMKCDAMRVEIEKLYRNKIIDKRNYFYYLASLLNSIDKYSNILIHRIILFNILGYIIYWRR